MRPFRLLPLVPDNAVAGAVHVRHFRPAYREIYYADRRTGGAAIQDADIAFSAHCNRVPVRDGHTQTVTRLS